MDSRHAAAKEMLESRRREILNEIHRKIREVRTAAAAMGHKAPDPTNPLDADIEEDIEFHLIQMKAETLAKIDEALARLHDGRYGQCRECGGEISMPRLTAVPFAVRCAGCEHKQDRPREGL